MPHFIHRFSKFMAIVGGVVLSLLILITCISILGRSLAGGLHSDLIQDLVPGLASMVLDLGVGPINGDFELVEAGMAFAVFAFLPITQLNAAHATVDIFTDWMSPRAQAVLQAGIDIFFAIVLLVLSWQLFQGTLDKFDRGQTTFLLQFPIWWAYALSLLGAIGASIAGIYVAYVRIQEVIRDEDLLDEDGAAH